MARQIAERRKQKRISKLVEGLSGLQLATMEEELTSLEQASHVIQELRHRSRTQNQLMIVWKRRLKQQTELIVHMQKDHDEQMQQLSSQLLVFESKLRLKQKEIRDQLETREKTIKEQDNLIKQLHDEVSRLELEKRTLVDNEKRNEKPKSESNRTEIVVTSPENLYPSLTRSEVDSLNDSDSAIMMEESLMEVGYPLPVPRFKSAPPDVKIMRSVSDAVECSKKVESRQKSCGLKRYNGYLKRPEILETVYSMEEENVPDEPPTEETPIELPDDTDSDDSDEYSSDDDDEEVSANVNDRPMVVSRKFLFGSYERLNSFESAEPSTATTPTQQQTTYNRVMSNHRAVIKPRDVKYKRINKARSRSLEELRGKLKNIQPVHSTSTTKVGQSFA